MKSKSSHFIQTLIAIFFCAFPLSPLTAEFTPQVVIFPHQEDLGRACAREMADLILANQSQGVPTVLGLATGSSPLPVYQAFKEIAAKENLDLSQVITFNLDEYCGLTREDPESYYSFMFKHLFNELLFSPANPHGLRLDNIHVPNGYAKKEEDLTSEELNALHQHFPQRACYSSLTEEEEDWILKYRAEKYEDLIRRKGPIQLQILGIGTNGHIGFAEPGSSLASKTMVVKLSDHTRQDNARFFDQRIERVPEYALTMGIKTILEAEKIILLASGSKKAMIIEKALNCPISSEIPATALRMHPSVSFLLDQAASAMGEGKMVRYYNARVVKNHELMNGELWTWNGKIIAPQEKADSEVDVKGLILAPGYIDLQINGAFGIDFSGQADQVQRVAALLPQYGVTSFLPTLVSLSQEQYPQLLPHLQPRKGGAHGAHILGSHLEGPFFHPSKCGAHNPHFISIPLDSLENVYGNLEGVKIVTLAPELPGAASAIQYLKSKHIVVSAGHTNATFEEAKTAFRQGITMATHLFNAMPPLHHRNPGIVGAVFSDDSIYYSIIADGFHLHPATIELAWKTQPKGLFLVTDAIQALGLPEGAYHLGAMEVDVQKNCAWIAGTQTLAGSVLSMDAAVQFFKLSAHCSIVDAIEAATLKPAKIIGIEDVKGNLNEGADADFILLDDELNVRATYVLGQLAWQKSEQQCTTSK